MQNGDHTVERACRGADRRAQYGALAAELRGELLEHRARERPASSGRMREATASRAMSLPVYPFADRAAELGISPAGWGRIPRGCSGLRSCSSPPARPSPAGRRAGEGTTGLRPGARLRRGSSIGLVLAQRGNQGSRTAATGAARRSGHRRTDCRAGRSDSPAGRATAIE